MSSTKRRALNGKVVVEEIKETEKTTAAGIILPELTKTAQRNKLMRGKVILHDKTEKDGTPVVPLTEGETVFFKNGVGSDITLDGKPYIILRAIDIELVD